MVTWDDFNKIWASASPLTPYEFSDPNYSQGWNFVGSTPPARQMWDSIQKTNDEKFKYLRDNFGTPHIVTQASDMTDTDMVYVYMGSEAGWNSGHWYYYDEGTSSWADGGVYNSVAFVTDTTLSIAGQPADAKAVGDALALKADISGCTFTGNVSVNADLSVTGDATMTGNVSAGADITVVGDVSSANIIASNNANIGGNATVTGSVASASLTTTADGTIGGNLSVAGTTTLTGDVTASADLSVAGDSSLTNLSVSGTTALAGTSTAPTPSADDNSTKIATTEYVQTEIKPIETDVTINDKRISNIEKLLRGNLYDYQTDSTSAYTKIVPSGAMPYAGLEQIGGKTIVMNQLAPAIDSTRWLPGTGTTLSFSDGVGTFTAGGQYGTVYANFGYSVFPITGHVYYIKGTFKIPQTQDSPILLDVGNFAYGSSLRINLKDSIVADTWFTVSKIATYSISASINAGLYITNGASSDWQTIQFKNIMLIDLTLLFGAGNEPSTVEEFESMFPASYYPHNEGELLSAGVTSAVSHSLNLADYSLGEGLPSDTTASDVPRKFTIGKYVVGITYNNGWLPARVTSHTVQNNIITQTINNYNGGVGIGIPFNCNSNTKYTVSAILPTNGAMIINWYKDDGTFINSGAGSTTSPKTYTSPSTAKYGVMILYATTNGTYTYSNIQIEEGETASQYRSAVLQNYSIPASIQALEGYGWSCPDHYNYIDYEAKKYVQEVGSRAYASGDESDSTVITDGTTTYYPLTTAVETDISAYLTDDNLIQVESGGTLTFPNSNGDDYQIPVPSEEEYMIDLQEAINNG